MISDIISRWKTRKTDWLVKCTVRSPVGQFRKQENSYVCKANSADEAIKHGKKYVQKNALIIGLTEIVVNKSNMFYILFGKML